MSDLPPPPPDHLPERPNFNPYSRYRRRRRFLSWWALLLGIAVGIGAGLYLAWVEFPVIETNTQPRQLSAEAKADYVVAVMLQYRYDSNLSNAISELLTLNLGEDPIQEVADIACDLASSGYVDSSAGFQAVRSMMTFYQLQGRTGCADTLLPEVEDPQIVEIEIPTPTPTLPPPPSKTPTVVISTPTQSGFVVVPTTPPQRDYEGRVVGTFCDTELSGIIEVFVQAFNSDGIPGEPVRVRWDGGQDVFVSGLKPERGPSYADFVMEAGRGYTIDMPGLSDPISTPLVAERCTTNNGGEAITSYRVVFRQIG